MLVFKIVKRPKGILLANAIGSYILNNFTQAAALAKSDQYACKIILTKSYVIYVAIDLSNSNGIMKLQAAKSECFFQRYLTQLFNDAVVLSKLDFKAMVVLTLAF